jgi:hypothetical protein
MLEMQLVAQVEDSGPCLWSQVEMEEAAVGADPQGNLEGSYRSNQHEIRVFQYPLEHLENLNSRCHCSQIEVLLLGQMTEHRLSRQVQQVPGLVPVQSHAVQETASKRLAFGVQVVVNLGKRGNYKCRSTRRYTACHAQTQHVRVCLRHVWTRHRGETCLVGRGRSGRLRSDACEGEFESKREETWSGI